MRDGRAGQYVAFECLKPTRATSHAQRLFCILRVTHKSCRLVSIEFARVPSLCKPSFPYFPWMSLLAVSSSVTVVAKLRLTVSFSLCPCALSALTIFCCCQSVVSERCVSHCSRLTVSFSVTVPRVLTNLPNCQSQLVPLRTLRSHDLVLQSARLI